MYAFTRLALVKWLLCAISISAAAADDTPGRAFIAGPWGLSVHGTTGVAGTEIAVVSETKAIILDRIEHNPLIDDHGNRAWVAEYDLTNDAVRALHPVSDTFCAAGGHISNGTFVNTGGHPASGQVNVSGLQGVRMYTPCGPGSTCDLFESPQRVRLTSPRWYPSAARLDDGSMIIFGGSVSPDYISSPEINNPTYEFFPPKNINGFNGLQIPSTFLVDALNATHFPIMLVLPDGNLFIAANRLAMIFNWRTNIERRLPGIPNGVRITSPFSASAVLLPLSPKNNYTPEVLICGGSTVSDSVDPSTLSSQTPASKQCVRMVLDDPGISAGWEVESMPQSRIMPDAILLPDGRVLLVNGAETGVAGFGNVKDLIGQSNADHPTFRGVLYDPAAPAGTRFSQSDLPTSSIARVYHSVATLTPNGTIMLAGSNPNPNVTTVKYATEYRVDWLSPSYMIGARPSYTGLPPRIGFGSAFALRVTLPPSATNVTVSLMDLGFSTHGVHMDQRLVQLTATLSSDRTILLVHAPPNGMVYPPGPGYLYIVTDTGMVSFGHKTIIGTGESPPVDLGAIENMLANTPGPSGQATPPAATGEGSYVPTSPIPAIP